MRIFKVIAPISDRPRRAHQAIEIELLRLAHPRGGRPLEAEHDDRVTPILVARIRGQPTLGPIERGRTVIGLVEVRNRIFVEVFGRLLALGLIGLHHGIDHRDTAGNVAALHLCLGEAERHVGIAVSGLLGHRVIFDGVGVVLLVERDLAAGIGQLAALIGRRLGVGQQRIERRLVRRIAARHRRCIICRVGILLRQQLQAQFRGNIAFVIGLGGCLGGRDVGFGGRQVAGRERGLRGGGGLAELVAQLDAALGIVLLVLGSGRRDGQRARPGEQKGSERSLGNRLHRIISPVAADRDRRTLYRARQHGSSGRHHACYGSRAEPGLNHVPSFSFDPPPA